MPETPSSHGFPLAALARYTAVGDVCWWLQSAFARSLHSAEASPYTAAPIVQDEDVDIFVPPDERIDPDVLEG